jgi:hypothetical protein
MCWNRNFRNWWSINFEAPNDFGAGPILLGYLSYFRIEGLLWIRFRRKPPGFGGIKVMVREVFSTSLRKHFK